MTQLSMILSKINGVIRNAKGLLKKGSRKKENNWWRTYFVDTLTTNHWRRSLLGQLGQERKWRESMLFSDLYLNYLKGSGNEN